jgi:hypothetical protein
VREESRKALERRPGDSRRPTITFEVLQRVPVLLTHKGAAQAACSPPLVGILVGRGWGWGVVRVERRHRKFRDPPSPTPQGGEGAGGVCCTS